MMRVSSSCDGCALRRVRCDSKRPCGECVSRCLECTSFRTRKKRGPKGPRAATYSKVRQAQRSLQQQYYCQGDDASSASKSATPPEQSPPAESPIDPRLGSSPESSRATDKFSLETYCKYLEIFQARLHPVWPVISTDHLIGRLVRDANDYGAWALAAALCAGTIGQLRLPEHLETNDCPPVSWQFVLEAQHWGRLYDYRERCNITSVLTSFFLHIYFANVDKLRTAGIYLRESITFAHVLHLDQPETYDCPESEERTLQLRVFWLLFISERTYCAQNGLPPILALRGEMPPVESDEGRSSDVIRGFASLTEIFAHLQGDIMDTASTSGKQVDLVKVVASQDVLRHDKRSHVLSEIQQVDLFVTRQWIRLLIWEYTMRHFTMSRETTEQAFSLLLPMNIGHEVLSLLTSVKSGSISAHGYGMELKLYRVADALVDILACSPTSSHESGMRVGLDSVLYSLRSVLLNLGGPKSGFVEKLQCRLSDWELAHDAWPYPVISLPKDGIRRISLIEENHEQPREHPLG